MSQGGVCSSRVRHSSRQPSPRNDGTGGSAFMPSWLTAYWLFSLAVMQPPRMWTSSRYRSSVAYIGRIARRCGGRSFATWIAVKPP